MTDEKHYGITSKKKYTHQENLQFWKQRREYRLDYINETGCETPGNVLLDSSLITRTKFKTYSHKIVECGNYIQVYEFDKSKYKVREKENSFDIYNSKKSKKINDNISKIQFMKIFKNRYKDLTYEELLEEYEEYIKLISKPKKVDTANNKYKKIEEKNLSRSKIELQRLVKTNEDIFKSFITLTFADNITDLDCANKKFDNWRRMVKRKKSDFAYVAVPEFQKRGAVHYHLLTNLDIKQNHDLIIPQDKFSVKQLKKMTLHQRSTCYDVKYWNKGYSSVFNVKDINVVAYMTKYMTKDIDNRLWGRRRYLSSQNLKKPKTSYIDLDTANTLDFMFYHKHLENFKINYENQYFNKYSNEVIKFREMKRVAS